MNNLFPDFNFQTLKDIPDYILKVANNYAWVLDAKAPSENIKESDHIEQVFSYAMYVCWVALRLTQHPKWINNMGSCWVSCFKPSVIAIAFG